MVDRVNGFPYRRIVSAPLSAFSLAEQLEEIAAKMYGVLAQRFKGAPGELFQRLHEEEMQHLERVRMLKRRYLHDRRAVQRVQDAGDQMLAALNDGKEMLATLENATDRLTLEEARMLMLAMEDKLAVAHADAMAAFADPSLRRFFEQLAQQDRAHAHLLSSP